MADLTCRCGKPSLTSMGLCRRHYNRWQRLGDPQFELDEPRACLGCETAFTPSRTDQVYCTRPCGKRTAVRRSRGLTPVVRASRECGWCEVTFTSTDGRKLYCSADCARIGQLLDEIGGKYGLAVKQYRRMYVAQGETCAICRNPESGPGRFMLCIDHCHESGQVRGLLCSNCNRAIGLLRDDPKVIATAAKYVLEHTQLRLIV